MSVDAGSRGECGRTEGETRAGLTRLAVIVRLLTAAAAILLAGMSHGLAAAHIVTFGWSIAYAMLMRVERWRTSATTVDIIIVAVSCALNDLVGPPDVIEHGGWRIVFAGGALLAAQMVLSPTHGLVACAVLAVAQSAGGATVETFLMLLLQGGLATTVLLLLSKSVRGVEHGINTAVTSMVRAAATDAVRADEAEHPRLVHDTGLATLTMIATGAVTAAGPRLSARATTDLLVLQGDQVSPPDGDATSLSAGLRALKSHWVPGSPNLRVDFDVAPIRVPTQVRGALVGSVTEALTNVARHSARDEAWVSAHETADVVVVTVRDRGRGVDLRDVPGHRRGLRESIQERMRSVGGTAEIRSRPGEGMLVTLRWHRDH